MKTNLTYSKEQSENIEEIQNNQQSIDTFRSV